MWLPTPVYERVPQFWFLLGLAFFAFGLYLGFDYQLIFVYFAVGAACIVRSVWILQMRRKYRATKTREPAPETLDPAENVEHSSRAESLS